MTNSNSNRPWKALRTPTPFMGHAPIKPAEDSGVRLATTKPPPAPEPHYDVDLTELEPSIVHADAKKLIVDAEKRARMALEMSQLKESFSKSEVDAVIDEAERLGMSITRSRSHVVVFDGENFTLARNNPLTRGFFKLDSFIRRLAEPKKRP
jgi:hypothetical protein